MKPGKMSSDEFLREAKLMSQLRHRKLVLLMGVCTTDASFYIITELTTNGSLLDYLKNETNRSNLTCDTIYDMAAQVNAVVRKET